MSYFNTSSDIPFDRQESLIMAILKCRIGNGVSYNSGVSTGAKEYYDKFLLMLDNDQLAILLNCLREDTILSGLCNEYRRKNLSDILTKISTPLVSDRVKEVIDYLLDDSNQISIQNKIKSSKFSQLTSVF